METPFEELLDSFHQPLRPTLIVTDAFLFWAIGVGNRRNIPVASFFPMSSTVFSVFYHLDLLAQHGHFPVDLSEKGNEIVDYIPGVSPLRLLDLPSFIFSSNQYTLHRTLDLISWIPKARTFMAMDTDKHVVSKRKNVEKATDSPIVVAVRWSLDR
ncbi:hypothetical protein D5086_018130 [Populus alba]|uniref:Uncharacterized protein n=1 Tax=Populus alba TaxID=43335 RepID=A0ACC4BNU5_POPAL